MELRQPGLQAQIRPASVVLTVEGPQRLIRSIGLESAVAWVDLPQEGPGTFAAEPVVTLPDGVKLLSVSPRQVEVMFISAQSPLRP